MNNAFYSHVMRSEIVQWLAANKATLHPNYRLDVADKMERVVWSILKERSFILTFSDRLALYATAFHELVNGEGFIDGDGI